MANPALSPLLETLAARGHRMTGQRLQLVAHLERLTASFSAEDLLMNLPSVGRATVYRTLKLLLDTGLLCRTVLPDGTSRYAPEASTDHHHHAVCVECGKVQQVSDGRVERAVAALAPTVDGQVLDHRLELYVRCSSCAGDAR